jgi:nicotinamidase-related amidase
VKKTKKRMLLIVLSVIFMIGIILVTATIFTGMQINTPTKGVPISQYDSPRSALLVIDVQKDTTSNTAYGDTAEFVEKVNQAIAFAQANGMDVLYVKNEYGYNPIVLLLSMGKYREGTTGAELDNRLQVVNDNVFSKSIGDSFSSKAFEDYLISKNIDTLYIIGADAVACVYSTAQGGVNRHYNVTIIKDAIITVNDDIMNQMLEQYASYGINVVDLAQFSELM